MEFAGFKYLTHEYVIAYFYVDTMTDEQEIRAKIEALEKQKSNLIEQLRRITAKLRYKKYEQKALEPFLEETKNIRAGPLKKQKYAIEFRIATQAYTPKMEREWLKEEKKIDEELEKVREVEKMRRKKMFVDQDIAQAEKEIADNEAKLNTTREELKKLYETRKVFQSMTRRGVKVGGFKEDIKLGDIGVIEMEG